MNGLLVNSKRGDFARDHFPRKTTEVLARHDAFSEVGEDARLKDTALMQELWKSSGINRKYDIGSPDHAYRQHGQKQKSIVMFHERSAVLLACTRVRCID
eukprot:COSAG02_NODE_34_length_49821_cov_105.420438_23_plen_100_part_00